MALTYAVLSVQNSLNEILKCLEEERLNKLKQDQELPENSIPAPPNSQAESKYKRLRKMIIPAALLVLAFGINNIDKIADFISPDPFEETNKKLAQIANQIQPSVKIELPDSIEQRDDVKQLRGMQDKIQYFNLNLRLLQERTNNHQEFDADSTMVTYYQCLIIDFKKVNEAFGQIIEGVIGLPTVYAYLNMSSLAEYKSIQEGYHKVEEETIEALTPLADSTKIAQNMKKFKPVMVKLIDASYNQADKQVELAKQIDIALYLALLDIKSDAINNADSPLAELMKLLGGLGQKNGKE
jgi:hypothetical protein